MGISHHGYQAHYQLQSSPDQVVFPCLISLTFLRCPDSLHAWKRCHGKQPLLAAAVEGSGGIRQRFQDSLRARLQWLHLCGLLDRDGEGQRAVQVFILHVLQLGCHGKGQGGGTHGFGQGLGFSIALSVGLGLLFDLKGCWSEGAVVTVAAAAAVVVVAAAGCAGAVAG